MKTKKVNQYQCDFCGKKNYSAGHMTEHEKHCTMNPNRECRMCAAADEDQLEMQTLLNIMPRPIWGNEYLSDLYFPWENKPAEVYEHARLVLVNLPTINEAIMELKAFVYCPACILATLRQRGIPPRWTEFNFKNECHDFWSDFDKSQWPA